MSYLDERDEPTPPAPGRWHEEAEPKTDVDAAPAPVLDLTLIEGARRALVSAARLTAAGLDGEALDDARRALELVTLAIGQREHRALLARLVEDTEPLLSGERDVRAAEVSP